MYYFVNVFVHACKNFTFGFFNEDTANDVLLYTYVDVFVCACVYKPVHVRKNRWVKSNGFGDGDGSVEWDGIRHIIFYSTIHTVCHVFMFCIHLKFVGV